MKLPDTLPQIVPFQLAVAGQMLAEHIPQHFKPTGLGRKLDLGDPVRVPSDAAATAGVLENGIPIVLSGMKTLLETGGTLASG